MNIAKQCEYKGSLKEWFIKMIRCKDILDHANEICYPQAILLAAPHLQRTIQKSKPNILVSCRTYVSVIYRFTYVLNIFAQ